MEKKNRKREGKGRKCPRRREGAEGRERERENKWEADEGGRGREEREGASEEIKRRE